MLDIEKKIKVAITHGDMNGIGYELMIRTFEDAEILELFTPIIYGSEKTWNFYSNLLGVKCPCNFIRDARDARDGQVNIISAVQVETRVEMGKATTEAENQSRQALDRALADYAQGLFDVLVMSPSSDSQVDFITEKLSAGSAEGEEETKKTLMPLSVLSAGNIHFASVAGNVDIENAKQVLSVDNVVEKAAMMRNIIKRDIREYNPRIAVMALNESIQMEEDTAEMSIIAPAISTLVNSGVQAFGPYTEADLLEDFAYTHYDGILGMYEGQCNSVCGKLFDDNGYILHSGLGLVVTSPVQDPSYDICGKGIADLTSFRSSIFAAIDIFRNRICYDIPLANPLQKIYHERREDGEKVRFAVKKKDFEPKAAPAEEK